MVGILAIGAAALAAGAIVALYMQQRRAAASSRQVRHLTAKLQENEEDIRSLRALFNALLAHTNAGILLLDDRLVIQAANASAVRLLDLARSDPKGMALAEATVSTELCKLVDVVRTSGRHHTAEIRRMGPGAGTVTVTVVRVGEGGWLVLADDQSELKRVEALRREFVANVSHELRTPMASIRAMAETLRDGAVEDPEVATRFLDTILAEAARLTRIADDLLTLSDAETKPPDLRPVNLEELCRRVVEGLEPQAERAGLTLRHELATEVHVFVDPYQMEQVIVNLVDNAIKYTPEGGTISVALGCDGRQAILSVADTGIGILQEHQPRIFERFFRVDKARSRQSGGTGLGLSIVKHIVEAHGGSVAVQSEYTRGSTFTVRLPCVTETGTDGTDPPEAQQL